MVGVKMFLRLEKTGTFKTRLDKDDSERRKLVKTGYL